MIPDKPEAILSRLGRAKASVTVVNHGYHPWSALWKRNQSLFWALATRRWSGRGVFVNPTADWRLLWQRGGLQSAAQASAARRALVPRRVGPHHWAWTPMGPLPFGRSPLVRRVNRELRTRVAGRLAGAGPRIVVLNNPFADADDVSALCAGAALVVFDASDDFIAYDHGGDEAFRARTAERCAALARAAHIVLAINPSVANWYRHINPNTHVMPNACHYERFAGCFAPDAPRAEALRALTGRYRRVAGYVGWMMEHRLDVALLRTVMEQHPDWGFVFVGPADREVATALRRQPNAHLWEPVSHDLLPSYIAGFDLCLLPHLVNAHTAGNDPLKLYEYLASGKPVVATPAAGVERFRELVTIGTTAAEFGDAITSAVDGDTTARRQARQEAARANSWSVRGDEMERLLALIAR